MSKTLTPEEKAQRAAARKAAKAAKATKGGTVGAAQNTTSLGFVKDVAVASSKEKVVNGHTFIEVKTVDGVTRLYEPEAIKDIVTPEPQARPALGQ